MGKNGTIRLFSDHEAVRISAQDAWQKRRIQHNFLVVQSCSIHDISQNVLQLARKSNCEGKPLIILQKNGREIFVLNIDSVMRRKIQLEFNRGATSEVAEPDGLFINNLTEEPGLHLAYIFHTLLAP